MAKEKQDDPSVFDVNNVRELVELMEQHELNEVELRQGDRRIKLRRGADLAQMVSYAAPPAGMAPAAAAAPAAADSSAAPAEDEGNFDFVKSPTVGTFYSKPKPDADDFVKVGDEVQADTVVCLVEAMKMFNEIQAGVAGKVVARLAENEQPVDNGMPLFKIAPN